MFPLLNNVAGQWLCGFNEDCIRVTQPGSVVDGNTIIDESGSVEAHHDGVQLIPPGEQVFVPGQGLRQVLPRAQYAAGLLGNVTIRRNHIRSTGALQGIFCSDGLLRDIYIHDNVIQTVGRHFITLSGLVSGEITGNLTAGGEPCPVLLMPLRIGGNPGTGSLWVLSFSDADLDYAPLDEIADQETQAVTKDLRRVGYVKTDTHLVNFDLRGFWVAAAEMAVPRDAIEHCKQLQRLALQYGDTV